MTVAIYDTAGQERDLTWLRTNYGNVQYLTPDNEGAFQKVFRLARVDVTNGPAVIQIKVQHPDGTPIDNQPVANHWPDDTLPSLMDGDLSTRYHDRAIFQRTIFGGGVGFGLGGGSYISNLAKGGPHTVWVLSPTYPSDGLAGIGMLGGTNHEGPLRLTFVLQDAQKEEKPTTPSTDSTVGARDEIVVLLRRLVDVQEATARHLGVSV